MAKIKTSFISLDEDSYHILVEGKIKRKKLNLLLDTGASRTVIDADVAAAIWGEENIEWQNQGAIGLGTADHPTGVVMAKKIVFGEIKFGPLALGVMNLSHLRTVYSNMGKPIPDGVLGNDLLLLSKAEIGFNPIQLKMFKKK